MTLEDFELAKFEALQLKVFENQEERKRFWAYLIESCAGSFGLYREFVNRLWGHWGYLSENVAASYRSKGFPELDILALQLAAISYPNNEFAEKVFSSYF